MQWRVQSWFWQQGDKQQKGQKWMLIHLEEKCGETSGLWLDGNTSVRGLNSGMRIQCKDSKQALAYQRHVLKYDKTLCELFIFWLFLEIHLKSNTNWSVFMCSLLASESYLLHYRSSQHFLTQNSWRLTFFSKELLKLAIYLTVFKRLFSHTSKLLNFNTANSLFFLCQNLSNLKHTHFMMYSEMKDLAYRLFNSSNGNTQSKYFRLV